MRYIPARSPQYLLRDPSKEVPLKEVDAADAHRRGDIEVGEIPLVKNTH